MIMVFLREFARALLLLASLVTLGGHRHVHATLQMSLLCLLLLLLRHLLLPLHRHNLPTMCLIHLLQFTLQCTLSATLTLALFILPPTSTSAPMLSTSPMLMIIIPSTISPRTIIDTPRTNQSAHVIRRIIHHTTHVVTCI